MKVNECKYKEKDRRLKEQFINGINDDKMMAEIIGELTTVKKTTEITSEQVIDWAIRWKHKEHEKHTQKPQKTINSSTLLKGMKERIIYLPEQNLTEKKPS